MFIADDNIHSIKRCKLRSVIITIRGSCLLGGCMNNLDCPIGVIPTLVFLLYDYLRTRNANIGIRAPT